LCLPAQHARSSELETLELDPAGSFPAFCQTGEDRLAQGWRAAEPQIAAGKVERRAGSKLFGIDAAVRLRIMEAEREIWNFPRFLPEHFGFDGLIAVAHAMDEMDLALFIGLEALRHRKEGRYADTACKPYLACAATGMVEAAIATFDKQAVADGKRFPKSLGKIAERLDRETEGSVFPPAGNGEGVRFAQAAAVGMDEGELPG
jgi:hypothetical protein